MLPTPDTFFSVRISRLPLKFTETYSIFCHWEYDKVTLACGLYYKKKKKLTKVLLIQ